MSSVGIATELFDPLFAADEPLLIATEPADKAILLAT
jgi:hypothetical protein